ncbi:MAG: hypothetical protein ACJAYD_000205 [Patiriisocius sp.]|jgi:hypothetical protein
MKTKHFIFLSFIAFTAISCQFDINLGQVTGNGNVQTEERNMNATFTEVKASSGLKIILEKGTTQKVVVEADDNLLTIIETYVENGMLRIRSNKNIRNASSKKVYVTYTTLAEVKASSGSVVVIKDQIKNERLTLDASSGANIEGEVFSKELYLEASSGASLDVSGKTKLLKTKASSGGLIDAENVLSVRCEANASSGGNISVNVKEHLEAKVSSGGNIAYYGEPMVHSASKNYSGGITKM